MELSGGEEEAGEGLDYRNPVKMHQELLGTEGSPGSSTWKCGPRACSFEGTLALCLS